MIIIFGPGDGNDFIAVYNPIDAGNPFHKDRLMLREGLIDGVLRMPTISDFQFARNDTDDLEITLKASGETISILRWFRNQDDQLLIYSGNELFDNAQIMAAANINRIIIKHPLQGFP